MARMTWTLRIWTLRTWTRKTWTRSGDETLVPKKSPGRDVHRGFVSVAWASCLSSRAPLPTVRVVPGQELALERLLLTGQRHALVLPMQLLQLRAAGVGHGRRRCG